MRSRVLILPLGNGTVEINRILRSPLKVYIESVRFVDGNGSKYIFLAKNLDTQIKITEELVKFVKKNISNFFELENDSNDYIIPVVRRLPFSTSSNKEIDDEIKSCTRCGLCLFGCPLYYRKKDERYSLRGLIMLIWTNQPKKIHEILNYCSLHCKEKICESICPVGISLSKVFKYLKNRKR